MPVKYRSNGKVLLTGEYLVLKGAKALALPTKAGQSLSIDKGSGLTWVSKDIHGDKWFNCELDPSSLAILSTSDEEAAQGLQEMLQYAIAKGSRTYDLSNLQFCTELEFDRNWGLGSSSTLICNIAAVFGVDPFELHFHVSNGSGYDIAAGITEGAVHYELNPDPTWFEVPFSPSFKDKLWFVYLGSKAVSSEEVAKFNADTSVSDDHIKSISRITHNVLMSNNLQNFNELIVEHEQIMSEVLKRPTIKHLNFKDFDGELKSLGAWGGDFALATGDNTVVDYFKGKGYSTILPYDELIIS